MKKMLAIFAVMVVLAGAGWGSPWDPSMPDLPTPDHPTLTLPQVKDHSYMINVQGILKNITGGSTVSDGNYIFVFILKRAQIGMDDLPANWVDAGWTETINNVAVKDGVFNVALGKTTPFPIFSPKYSYSLQITFNGDTMTTYQPLLSVPIAITARNLWGGAVAAKSTVAVLPSIFGTNTSNGFAIYGLAAAGYGVGASGAIGVWGHSPSGPNLEGVLGTSVQGWGVMGLVSPEGKSGVIGMTTDASFPGDINTGVIGASNTGKGVYGQTNSKADWTAGVYGYNSNAVLTGSGAGKGVMGFSERGHGVHGTSNYRSTSSIGVCGENLHDPGFEFGGSAIYADASKCIGITAISRASTKPALFANNAALENPGPALEIGNGHIQTQNNYYDITERSTALCHTHAGTIKVNPNGATDSGPSYFTLQSNKLHFNTDRAKRSIIMFTIQETDALLFHSNATVAGNVPRIVSYSWAGNIAYLIGYSGDRSPQIYVHLNKDITEPVYINYFIIN